MRKLGWIIGRFLIAIVAVGVLVWAVGPREPVVVDVAFDESQLARGVDAYLAQAEALVPDITPNTEKRVIWAGAPETKTPVSIVYIHGFSASSEEVRPVPDLVAAALGANLYYTRLKGHGRPRDTLAEARVEDWMNDTAEALAIGRAIGDEVIVMSTSTGGTLSAVAALDRTMSAQVAGMVFVSPNFEIKDPKGAILTWPLARYWLPVIMPGAQEHEPTNEGHATFWTSGHSSLALLPMAAIVKYAAQQDFSETKVPALFYFTPEDQVVNGAKTLSISEAWGGSVTLEILPAEASDDPNSHVITGDIRSPSNTQSTVERILSWAQTLEAT